MFLYTPDSVYSMDRAAVENDGLAETLLMQRAGERVWSVINQSWPEIANITVFAGSGNNGGDAFVVAILAKQQGLQVQLLTQGDLSKQSNTAAHFYKIWQQAGGCAASWQRQPVTGELIVDGLLGIGLQRELNADWRALIQHINQHPVPKVAIDIPSGLNASTGMPQPCAVEADCTITFIGRKVGQVLADGLDYCGKLVFDDLGISSKTASSQPPALQAIDTQNVQLPAKRKANSHKSSYGHVLVIGGDRGMSGAASMAGQAALRAGAGMVSVLVHPGCVHDLSHVPELMVQSWDEVDSALKRASVIVVGPGLGQSDSAKACLQKLADVNLPIVVDASAITADFLETLSSEQLIITPHPGEAAGLFRTTTQEVQSDRLQAIALLTQEYPAVCVLKGSGTLIQHSGTQPTAINLRGNAGMASAGMGDVLAGMIAAYLGQQLSSYQAARTAVFIHALCAEDFADDFDQSGLIASDITQRIAKITRQLRRR
ncbi:MAG: NAD(P)H-hydrate dehydratase [Gammaproteobacteria bacterium]|nr:NAD(P)H-hydrate dehydratase [Gammaproteobacteria bacterium]